MPEFSLELNEDQLQLQKWIHEFAVDVIRPAASEWDEREEFPFPIVEQAAQIGLYGWEFMAEAIMNDPTGITMPMAIEELFWGRCRHWHGDHGFGSRSRWDHVVGHPRAGHGNGCRSVTAPPTT